MINKRIQYLTTGDTMKKIIAAITFGMLALTGAQAAEIRVLSAGAVEPGLHAFAALVKRELGHELKITFNTAPQIAKRLAANEVQDLLVSPPAVVEQAAKEGKGAVSLDGRLIDIASIRMAEALIEKANSISGS